MHSGIRRPPVDKHTARHPEEASDDGPIQPSLGDRGAGDFGVAGRRSFVPVVRRQRKDGAQDLAHDDGPLHIPRLHRAPAVELPIHLADRLGEQVDRAQAKGGPEGSHEDHPFRKKHVERPRHALNHALAQWRGVSLHCGEGLLSLAPHPLRFGHEDSRAAALGEAKEVKGKEGTRHDQLDVADPPPREDPQDRGPDHGAQAGRAEVNQDVQADRRAPRLIAVEDVRGDAGHGVAHERDAAATKEARRDEGGEVLGQADGDEEADEAEIRAEENGADPQVFHGGEQEERENGGAHPPGCSNPVGVRKRLVAYAEFLRDGLVSYREDTPVHRADEACKKSEPERCPFLPKGPVEGILWVVGSFPCDNDDLWITV